MLVLVVDKELRALLLLFFEFQWDIENQTSNFLAHLVIYWVLSSITEASWVPDTHLTDLAMALLYLVDLSNQKKRLQQ